MGEDGAVKAAVAVQQFIQNCGTLYQLQLDLFGSRRLHCHRNWEILNSSVHYSKPSTPAISHVKGLRRLGIDCLSMNFKKLMVRLWVIFIKWSKDNLKNWSSRGAIDPKRANNRNDPSLCRLSTQIPRDLLPTTAAYIRSENILTSSMLPRTMNQCSTLGLSTSNTTSQKTSLNRRTLTSLDFSAAAQMQ